MVHHLLIQYCYFKKIKSHICRSISLQLKCKKLGQFLNNSVAGYIIGSDWFPTKTLSIIISQGSIGLGVGKGWGGDMMSIKWENMAYLN